MENKLRVLELFSGIGACSKALENLNIDHEIVDAVEIDKYAIKSFNAIHGTNFEPQDITKWDKEIQIDLLMHGSPCQDFSLAGLQEGGDEGSGTRSSLMYETLRIVNKLKPKYVIWENVKNLLSKKHKHNFDAYIQRMEQMGYKSYYQVLNAKDYGIPQNRERVFTISILDHKKMFYFPKRQLLKLKLKDMLENEVDEKYYLSEKMINYISANGTENYKTNDSKINLDIARPLTTDQSKRVGTTNYLSEDLPSNYDLSIKIKNATRKGYLEAQDGDGVDIGSRMKYHRGNVQKGMAHTLDCLGGEGHGVVVKNMKQDLCDYLIENEKVKENDMIRHSYTSWRKEKEFHTENSRNNNISATLTTRPDTLGVAVRESVYSEGEKKLFTEDGNIRRYIDSDIVDQFEEGQMATTSFPNGYGHGPRTHDESICLNCIDKPSVKQNLRIRKLTPKECFRLMGFSDEDYLKASEVNSNAQLYKQAGNSIVVNVLMEILKKLLLEDNNFEGQMSIFDYYFIDK